MEFEPRTWYDIDIVSRLFFIRKDQKLMSDKDGITKTAYYEMERASDEMEDMRIST